MPEGMNSVTVLSAISLLNGAFRRLLHMSIAGSLGILLVLLLRQWINRRCGRGYSYGAWLIVFLYLCIPVMVPWEVSPFTGRILAYLEDTEQPSQDNEGNLSSDEHPLEQSPEWMAGQSGESQSSTEDAEETGSDATAGIVPPGSSEGSTGNIGNIGNTGSAGNIGTSGNTGNTGNNSNIIPSAGVQPTAQSTVPELLEETVESEGNSSSDAGSESSKDTVISGNHPSTTDPLQDTKKGISLLTVLSLIWIAGILSFLITMLTSFLHLQSRLSSATKLEAVAADIERWDYYDNVYQCLNINGAFVWGLLPGNTRIYVPCGLSSEEQEAILRHEGYHQKRHDNIVKPLMLAILALHWFNPLVWLAYHYLVVDMELSCDEGVISRMESKEDRARYATALLSVAARKNRILLVTGMGTAISTKKRIQAILSYKGGSAMKKGNSAILLLVLALILGACAAQQLPNSGGTSDVPTETQEGAEDSTKENDTESDVTEEISSEGTSTETSPTKPATTEPATESMPPETVLEEIPIPTTPSGELIGNPDNSTGADYQKLLLLYSSAVFDQWKVKEAAIKDGFYYADYLYPMVNDFAFTLYQEPSVESESFRVEPYEILYAKATDRLHWVYMETADQSISGWLYMTLNEDHYEIVPIEGADSIDIDQTSFATDKKALERNASEERFGTIHVDSPLLNGLGESDGIMLFFENMDQLKAYVTENEMILQQESDLWENLNDTIYRYGHFDDASYIVTYVKDVYSGASGMLGRILDQEDGSQKCIILPQYGNHIPKQEASGYFQIFINYDPLSRPNISEYIVHSTFYNVENLSEAALLNLYIQPKLYIKELLMNLDDVKGKRYCYWYSEGIRGEFELIWWNEQQIFFKSFGNLRETKVYDVCKEGDTLRWVEFDEDSGGEYGMYGIHFGTENGMYKRVNIATGELLPSYLIDNKKCIHGLMFADTVIQDGILNYFSNETLWSDESGLYLYSTQNLFEYRGIDVQLKEGEYMAYGGLYTAIENNQISFDLYIDINENEVRDENWNEVLESLYQEQGALGADPCTGYNFYVGEMVWPIAEECRYLLMDTPGSLFEVTQRDFLTVFGNEYCSPNIYVIRNYKGEVVEIGQCYTP